MVEEYEFDEAMEPSYMESMFRQFNKTLDEGFFNMVLVDAVNHRVSEAVVCVCDVTTVYYSIVGLFHG